jgi:hypothetical protein
MIEAAYVSLLRPGNGRRNTPVEAERVESYIVWMAVYLARNCPMCRNFFGVTIAKPNGSGYRPIHGRCATCGYEIAWALITS